ncbi:unnamed protein product [Schistosoma curassoni]|uniref:Uncharacterized protein n=1 Tax=Schistosoma curassoni TaxID=6186 RepID=A0A183JH31_9TREM|nr:unnamed protein product [Schistosoma curassoni]
MNDSFRGGFFEQVIECRRVVILLINIEPKIPPTPTCKQKSIEKYVRI